MHYYERHKNVPRHKKTSSDQYGRLNRFAKDKGTFQMLNGISCYCYAVSRKYSDAMSTRQTWLNNPSVTFPSREHSKVFNGNLLMSLLFFFFFFFFFFKFIYSFFCFFWFNGCCFFCVCCFGEFFFFFFFWGGGWIFSSDYDCFTSFTSNFKLLKSINYIIFICDHIIIKVTRSIFTLVKCFNDSTASDCLI